MMQAFRVPPEILGGLEDRLQLLGGHPVPCSPPAPSSTTSSPTPPPVTHDENSNIKDVDTGKNFRYHSLC